MKEPLPLARVHDAVLEFLRHRPDAVLFGAQAVNAYVEESRMTQDVDILSPRAELLAEEVRAFLVKEFTIAARVRKAGKKGFRIFQLGEPKNRHLATVTAAEALPPNVIVDEIRIGIPEELIAQIVMAYSRQRSQPQEGLYLHDLKLLLLKFTHLKSESGPVMERLVANGADAKVIGEWKALVASEIIVPEEDEGY